jgi:alpha-tubulin suppressor-like RCC1 family protein
MNRMIAVTGILALLGGCSGRGAATARPDGTPDADPPADRPYAVELAGGLFHTCARMSDGTVRCWGMGEDGQLGDGAKTNRNAPVAVTGLDHVVQLVAEGSRSCAVRDDATVWCWGPWATVDAVEAQLAADASVPLDLVRASPERDEHWANVRRLAIGSGNDCAVDTEGRVLCRGSNTRGGVGDGSTERRLAATVVPGVEAVDVAVEMDSTCAVTEDGRVLCWGWNDYCGQLGDGSMQDRLTPVEVPGLAGVTSLAAGTTFACAVIGDGTLRCWGCNEVGQLGDGSTEQRATPTAVPGLAGVRRVDVSASQTCATLADGTARCWGGDTPAPASLWTACPTPQTYRMEGPSDGGIYRIGPEETYCPTPAPIPGVTDVRQALPAALHACVLLRDGTVRCWGSNFYGSVGDGTGGGLDHDRSVPTPVAFGG